jgi:hypothetical protein
MLTAKVEELVAENERLTSALTAHQALKMICGDSSQPATVRVRAAQAALGVETPSLKPVAPAIDSTCEEIEPLAVVIERQRKRMDALQGRNIEVLPSGQVLLLDPNGNGGNGQDD